MPLHASASSRGNVRLFAELPLSQPATRGMPAGETLYRRMRKAHHIGRKYRLRLLRPLRGRCSLGSNLRLIKFEATTPV